MFVRAQRSGKRTYLLIVENEWADVIRDLDNLVEMEITVSDKCYTIRSNTEGTIANVFSACGVALPPLLSQC